MFELLLMVPDYVILSLTCWLELVLHLHCYTQWKRIIGSPVHPEDPKEVKIGQYRVFLLPATTASIKNPPQPHYQLSWCKATRTREAISTRSWRGKSRLRALGDPVQVAGVMGSPPLLEKGRLYICKQYKGGYTTQSTVQHSARTQQISTEHHHCLMRLKSMKILFWAVSHKIILLVQPFISLSSLKLDTWDPNQQNVFYMCMEFRQSFRCKI